MLFKLLKDYNVTLIGDHSVREVNDDGVVIMDRNWKTKLLPTDTVVTAFGMRSNTDDFDKLLHICPDTFILGDAGDGVKSIGNACYTAFWATVEE